MNFYEILLNRGAVGEGMTHFERLFAQKIGGGVKELSGVPPLTFKANGQPLRDWSMSGQTVQASIPNPSSPVYASGVGERTGNLFDRLGTYTAGAYTNLYAISGLDTSQQYTCSTSLARVAGATAASIYLSQSTSASAATNGVWLGEEKTFTPNENGELYVLVRNTAAGGAPAVADDVIAGNITIMLNTGSTAQPYEPYGWCVPVTCGGQTTNIYLGSATSTRRIKKLVLTGTEEWTISNNVIFVMPCTGIISGYYQSLCDRYVFKNTFDDVYNNDGTFAISNTRLIIHDENNTTVQDFKTYLAQQYAAGTPVTIWYVLATEETGTLNEPLMKIGSYADELTKTGTGVDIPTTKGNNTLSVNTTVQPSNMYIKYHT